MPESDTQVDDTGPWFDLFFPDADSTEYVQVGRLLDPRFEDMFWHSYRIEAVSSEAEVLLRHEQVWQADNFIVQLPDCSPPRITSKTRTYPGLRGTREYCAGRTDRMSFRSLAPFRRKEARTTPRLLMSLVAVPVRLASLAPEIPLTLVVVAGLWFYAQMPIAICSMTALPVWALFNWLFESSWRAKRPS